MLHSKDSGVPFDQSQIVELKEAFDYIDVNHDGVIDESDLQELLASFGMQYNAKEMLTEGSLNFNTFMTMFASKAIIKSVPESSLLAAFELLDKRKTGWVDAVQLEKLMTSGEQPLQLDQAMIRL